MTENKQDWRIDHSAGRPILVYQNCSVIEAEQAEYVLRLIKADKLRAAGEPSDEEILQTFSEACEYADRCGQGFSYGRAQALRAVLARYGRPAGGAQPVAWVAADTLNSPHPRCVSSLAYMSQIDQDRGREYAPLYAAPVAAQKADDARDAERYRWLKDLLDNEEVTAGLHEAFMAGPEAMDAALDAAIAQQRKGEGEQ